MSDLISRQTAMNAFAEYVKRSNNSDFAPTPTWNDAVEIVENLPSAQPECDDTVSRKAEIDAIKRYIRGFDAIDVNFLDGLKTAIQIIEQLPHEYSNAQNTLQRVGSVECEDAVSRQAALDAMENCEPGEEPFVIKSLPSVDAVKVVRCKDCKHRDPEDKKCDFGHDIIWQLPRRDDWYCADGEQKK